MGIFSSLSNLGSSIKSAFGNEDLMDRMNAIGQSMQGDEHAYENWQARKAKRKASDEQAEIMERQGWGRPTANATSTTDLAPVDVQQLPQRAAPIVPANLPLLSPQALALSQMIRPIIRRF